MLQFFTSEKQYLSSLETSLWFSALVAVSLHWAETVISLDSCVESCSTLPTLPIQLYSYTVTRLPSTWALQPTCLSAANRVYIAPDHLHPTHRTTTPQRDNIFNNICICFAVRPSVFLSVLYYMLNTTSTHCGKEIKISRKITYLFSLVQNYWEKQMSLQTLRHMLF